MEGALSPIQAYLNPATPAQQQQQHQHQHQHQQPQPQTIKMEDVEQSAAAVSQPLLSPEAFSPSTPAAELSKSAEQKPVKKRKSWGQVLPEPKTNLPPRKRAKTADEKEQRRIERVKRNRLAAHNSRERKRQEVELLQTEKELLERKLRQAQETMAKMAQQLQSLQEQTGIKVEPVIPSSTFDFAPNLPSETINPRQASTSSFESPALTIMSYDSADSPMQPQTPMNESSTQEPDPTQHSAAMLCDLQCRSGSNSRTTTTRFHLAMNFFILLNIQLCTMTALSTIFSHSTRFRALLTRTKASSPPRSWLAWPNLLTTSPASIYLAALRVSSICTPTQAQHLLLATSMALQRVASSRSLSLRSDGGRASVHSGFDQERFRQENMTRMWRALTETYESSSRGTNSAGIAEDIKRSCEALDSILGRAETGRQKEFRRI